MIGSSSNLDVRIIHPRSNSVLGLEIFNWKLQHLPSVDSGQAVALMKKHIFVVESIINYGSDDDADICEPKAVMYSSIIHLLL